MEREKILARQNAEQRVVYLSPEELREKLSAKSILYMPVGSIEWHNEHLPIGTDTFHAEALAMELCGITGGAVLPSFWWNTDSCHRHPSTYYTPQENYRQMLSVLLRGFMDFQVKMIVLVNGHGGGNQIKSVAMVTDEINRAGDFPIHLAVVDVCDLQHENIDHADTGETSLSMRLIPQLVRMEREITPALYSGEMPFADGIPPTAEKGDGMFWELMTDALKIIEREYNNI